MESKTGVKVCEKQKKFFGCIYYKDARVTGVGSQKEKGPDGKETGLLKPIFEVEVGKSGSGMPIREVIEGNGVKEGEVIPLLCVNLNVGVTEKGKLYAFLKKVEVKK